MSSGTVIDRYYGEAKANFISPPAHRIELPPGSSPREVSDVAGLIPMTFGEFVQFRFVPEYVANRSPSVQSHLLAILKYVLTPERVADAFGFVGNDAKRSMRTGVQRPYMDTVPLGSITPEVIEGVMLEYVRLGYAGQTIAHIKNALRTIFKFAASCGCHSGRNPAIDVPAPNIDRKQRHILALANIKKLIPLMRHPEREIALIIFMTGLHVTEVCGLQWKYVNFSNAPRLVEGELVPPGTLAIRNQSYRGTFGPVSNRRRQIVAINNELTRVLQTLMRRGKFTAPDDFVLCSRNGTPINPDNIALRRLKPIGVSLQMPWLSWKVFGNSRTSLAGKLGKLWVEHLNRAATFKER